MTRAAALDRLAATVPRAGRAYAEGRGTDAGPDAEPTTTALSPFLRRRLLLEEEAVAAALAAHGPQAAERFVGEVFWRTYFKGHLETHPAAWTGFLAALARERARMETSSGLRRAHAAAVGGTTGIEGFDDWARELVDTGWLHNHARMWFASIWIFTLRLPWELGADFFLRHLLDGDPASNTLSWRWVAGLHTRGKAYAARAENIRRYTDGRFSPAGLNEHPAPLEEAEPPRLVPLPPPGAAPEGEVALLLHLDDLHPEEPGAGRGQGRAGGRAAGARARRLGGGARGRHPGDGGRPGPRRRPLRLRRPGRPSRAGRTGCRWWRPGRRWVRPRTRCRRAACGCAGPGTTLAWPHATRGYFSVRAAIPAILREAGMG